VSGLNWVTTNVNLEVVVKKQVVAGENGQITGIYLTAHGNEVDFERMADGKVFQWYSGVHMAVEKVDCPVDFFVRDVDNHQFYRGKVHFLLNREHFSGAYWEGCRQWWFKDSSHVRRNWNTNPQTVLFVSMRKVRGTPKEVRGIRPPEGVIYIRS
jgi:hypothetical protein